jgi:elongation factor G
MDRVGASYDWTIKTIRQRLGANPIAIQMPIEQENRFLGVIDLITEKAIYWDDDDMGREPREEPIPEEMMNEVGEKRTHLVEKIAELDDDLTIKFLENEKISVEELKSALRKAVLNNKAAPVLCGSSLKNKGVQPVLDAVIDYLPSPADVPPVKGTDPDSGKEIFREHSDDAPMSALVFKIVTDPYVGRLAYFRVYSGKVTQGVMSYNINKDKRERIGRLLRMYADHREDISEVYAGDIGAVLGFKETFTGDTLCDQHHKILLENIVFPEPVISVAIEPKTTADQDKMKEALRKLSEEDPTFRVHTDENTSQTIISGMGELHLDVIVDRMLREFRVQANVGKPRVSYRETITNPVADLSYKYAKQSGGHGQYGHVVIDMDPMDRGTGIVFENKVIGGKIPKEFIPAVEKGIREAAETGSLGGYEVTDLKVTLVDGSYHEVDSSEMAFKMAGIFAFREAMQKGHPVLLEPIMKVEVLAPEEYLGDILAQLNSRRATILGTEMRPGKAQSARAAVPLSEMTGYATQIRSITQGRGVFSMEFDHYQPVPANVAEKILNP